jgi:hypothetical protein
VEVALEGDHVFAAVRRDDVSQCWHGPWHLGLSETCMKVPFDTIPEHSNCSINFATHLFRHTEYIQLLCKSKGITNHIESTASELHIFSMDSALDSRWTKTQVKVKNTITRVCCTPTNAIHIGGGYVHANIKKINDII